MIAKASNIDGLNISFSHLYSILHFEDQVKIAKLMSLVYQVKAATEDGYKLDILVWKSKVLISCMIKLHLCFCNCQRQGFLMISSQDIALSSLLFIMMV